MLVSEKENICCIRNGIGGALEAWDFQWKISFSYLVGIPAIPKAFGIKRVRRTAWLQVNKCP